VGGIADTILMFATSLDGVVDGLPAPWVALPDDFGWVVIGPTGAFALTSGDPDVPGAGLKVARAAAATRAALAARLSWAPFVDPLVVVDGPAPPAEDAAVVPARLLADVLTSGPVVLQEDQIARIVQALT
jgi:hypothetical protein